MRPRLLTGEGLQARGVALAQGARAPRSSVVSDLRSGDDPSARGLAPVRVRPSLEALGMSVLMRLRSGTRIVPTIAVAALLHLGAARRPGRTPSCRRSRCPAPRDQPGGLPAVGHRQDAALEGRLPDACRPGRRLPRRRRSRRRGRHAHPAPQDAFTWSFSRGAGLAALAALSVAALGWALMGTPSALGDLRSIAKIRAAIGNPGRDPRPLWPVMTFSPIEVQRGPDQRREPCASRTPPPSDPRSQQPCSEHRPRPRPPFAAHRPGLRDRWPGPRRGAPSQKATGTWTRRANVNVVVHRRT